MSDDAAKPRIQSVARAAQILAAVAASRDGLTAKQISEQVGIRLPTTYHLLHTLGEVGLLRRGGSGGTYVIGYAAADLARALERQASVPEELARAVRAVAVRTDETVYGSGWSGGEIVVVTRTPGTQPVSVADVPLGLAGHAHARAAGKLLLAFAEPDARARYLERHPPVALTPRTVAADALEAQLAAVREGGVAIEEEEFAEGICCLAAPCAIGGTTFAVTLSAPAERFRANVDRYREALLSETQHVSLS